ncbi:MAG: SEL1-like repeat protein [Pseudomonadota bacterium]
MMNVNAQCCLGVVYSNGDGVSQNYQEAMKWLNKAAAGSVKSMP